MREGKREWEVSSSTRRERKDEKTEVKEGRKVAQRRKKKGEGSRAEGSEVRRGERKEMWEG